jgi:hypothetical protein
MKITVLRDLSYVIGISLTSWTSAALSQETTSYNYDALGRLIRSDASVGNQGNSTRIQYDKADNRANVNVAPSVPSSGGTCTVTADNAFPVAGYVDTIFFVPVTVSSGCSGTVVVNFSTRDGTARAGQHYPAASGSLSFSSPGTQRVRVYGYAGGEDKYYFMDLSSSTAGAAVTAPSYYVNIEYP